MGLYCNSLVLVVLSHLYWIHLQNILFFPWFTDSPLKWSINSYLIIYYINCSTLNLDGILISICILSLQAFASIISAILWSHYSNISFYIPIYYLPSILWCKTMRYLQLHLVAQSCYYQFPTHILCILVVAGKPILSYTGGVIFSANS